MICPSSIRNPTRFRRRSNPSRLVEINALEIAGFRESRGMIRGVFGATELFQICRARRFQSRGKEFFGRNVGGTGSRDQDAVAVQPRKSGLDKFSIGAQSARLFRFT